MTEDTGPTQVAGPLMRSVTQAIQVVFGAPGNQCSGREASQCSTREGGFPGSCGEDVRASGLPLRAQHMAWTTQTWI